MTTFKRNPLTGQIEMTSRYTGPPPEVVRMARELFDLDHVQEAFRRSDGSEEEIPSILNAMWREITWQARREYEQRAVMKLNGAG